MYTKILTGAVIPPGKVLQDKDIVPRTVAPSKCRKSKMSESVNRELSKKEIKKLICQFVEGAVRVQKQVVTALNFMPHTVILFSNFYHLILISVLTNTAVR